MKDTIKLLINRKWETIQTNDILYITISDKLSFLHLKDNVTLNLFITLSELEQLLPRADFVRISRNCIINYHAIYSIHDTQVTLTNNESLPYSKRREKSILDGYQNYVQNKYAAETPDPLRQSIDFHEKYKSFDNIPIAFAVIEMVVDSNGHSIDFVFRYANQALAELEGVPLKELEGNSFFTIFPDAQTKWLSIYREVAFEGKEMEIIDFRQELKKVLRIQCFQPIHGYCACLLTDVTGKDSYENSRFICPRKFTDADICQRFLPLLNDLSHKQLDSLETLLSSMKKK